MGVYGLWDILLTTAQKIDISKLSGKILAIDASIWLVKAQSIFGEDSQKIKIILQKIIYLRKNNILPVFVFDGISPAIKRKTLQKRKQRLRQGSEIDIRKKTQIQVMHILQNNNNNKKGYLEKQSSKDKKIIQKQQKMQQIDKLLLSLNQVQISKSSQISQDDLQKIKLQSDVLTYKYQLMKQDIRYQGLQTIKIQQFSQFSIQQKLQYLNLVEQQSWNRQSRKNKRSEISQFKKFTHEQQILYEMKKIQKKTKLRQLQNQLYRKHINNNVKIQNGFEIIQQVRNGRKIIMKRKINQQKQQDIKKFGIHFNGKKKQKNDFGMILNYNNNDNDIKDEYQNFGNQPDPFLKDLIQTNFIKNKQDQKSSSISIPSGPLLKISSKPRKLNVNGSINQQKKQHKVDQKMQIKVNKKPKKQNKLNQRKSRTQQFSTNRQSEQQQSQFKIPGILQQHQSLSQIASQAQKEQNIQKEYDQNNPDKLPLFINYQNLSLRNLDNISHRNIQFQQLLQMLGIPYIKAPSQAQAQCAFFQMQNLVDGIVTQDSDTFLFGAKSVFRGVFNDNVRYFSSTKIQQKLLLNQQKLIIFALLLGSDYTQGIKGIGIVNAMEILKVVDTFQKLQNFKKWARYADILQKQEQNKTQNILKQLNTQQQKQFYEFHKKFKNYWYIDDDFPKKSVINAYIKPQVLDNSRIKQIKQENFFKLKQFNQQVVKVFMKEKLLLTYSQIQNYCKILKKQFKRQNQKKMTDYFFSEDKGFAIIRSKRLLKALQTKRQNNNKHEQINEYQNQDEI